MRIIPVLLKDFYKAGHINQYEKGTTLIYSNLTPRGTRRDPAPGFVVNFGVQGFVKEWLIDYFNDEFFNRDRDTVVNAYKRRLDTALGPGQKADHIGELHELGYLPLHVKALPEGTLVPYRVPVLTVYNTDPKFFWLTNMLETLFSNGLWKAMTSATTAFLMRREFIRHAREVGGDLEFTKWQGHDFHFRGAGHPFEGILAGAGHLMSFTGTDTIPAIDYLEQYYGADAERELVGGSVPATEHSVMCLGGEGHEFETFKRLITEVYPSGIVSIVSDTWDFWQVLTDFLPRLKEAILARNGKVVIRPDSGNPVKIICGDPDAVVSPPGYGDHDREMAIYQGALKTLWNLFGGTTTDKDYKVLDSHIGLIYGDSISPARQTEILDRSKANGFWYNGVLGVGSYTYEHVTRDTDGFAIKATYGEVNREGRAIFKDPKTDDGVKKSARGLLRVEGVVDSKYDVWKGLIVHESCTWDETVGGLLQTVFLNGSPYNFQGAAQIRARIEAQL